MDVAEFESDDIIYNGHSLFHSIPAPFSNSIAKEPLKPSLIVLHSYATHHHPHDHHHNHQKDNTFIAAMGVRGAKTNTNDWSNWFNSFNRGQRPFEVRGYRSTGRGRSGGLITTFFARWIQKQQKKRKSKRTATAQTIDRAIITLRSGCYEPQWINRSSGCVRNIGYNWKPPGENLGNPVGGVQR